MSLNLSPSQSNGTNRHTLWLWISGIAALLFTGSELASLWMNSDSQIWMGLPILMVLLGFGLLLKGHPRAAGVLFIMAIGLQALLAPVAQSGLSLPNAITSLALITSLSLVIVPRRYVGRVLIVALLISTGSILIDLFDISSPPVAALQSGRWIFSLIVVGLLAVFFAREFPSLDIRTKIVIGILATGGTALAILVSFALYQAQQTTDALTSRLDASVNRIAEQQLINTAFVEANGANQEFQRAAEQVASLAEAWASLRGQRSALGSGIYWDARTKLAQLEEGQYGNPSTDTSSVFVPVGIEIDETLVSDLNVSAYLDFAIPEVLEKYPSLLAMYAIDTSGVTRYYPNIDLASLLPPDFDATKRPYYAISSPLFNPKRLPRWTIPYIDATGAGLVVTVAAPVYEGDEFVGVVAADMQLSQITEQTSAIKVGETGYAFMLDDAGRVLSMPPKGYEMFGVRPEDLNSHEFFKQTVLGLGTPELRSATTRMTAGGHGLLIANINGVDTYFSFYPIKASGYSLALVVPVVELQGPILAARNQTTQQLWSAARGAAILLVVMLVLAIFASLGLGSLIAAPIQRLTQVAGQVSSGDLSVQAAVTTEDEIGTLAVAFNTMTSRLRETMQGMEKTVEARTAELVAANQSNERRAKQFEAIARIARTISSTQDLDVLLQQITTVIHSELGFYHVGIFLVDTAREYAVLSASNSEGGRSMLERGHRLKVGETGLVGYVTGTGKPRVALDTGADAVYFDNPELPETRSELTLPLRVGEEIIGALDVQSTQPGAFSQEDINILSTLADQVSIAIQNARQFEQTRKALNESEVLARQFVQTGWQQFTKSKNLLGIRHTGARSTFLHRRNGKREQDLLNSDLPRSNKRGAQLSIPIKLRGEVIGSVDVKAPDNRPWDKDDLDIVTAIIERAAIAMENARLLAESQKRAAKERIIGEIAAKISMQSEIDDLLKTAAQELGRNLPGAEIAIQFNKETE